MSSLLVKAFHRSSTRAYRILHSGGGDQLNQGAERIIGQADSLTYLAGDRIPEL